MKRHLIIIIALAFATGLMAQSRLDGRPRVRNAKKMSYEEFVKATDSTYAAFRDSINKAYAEFMRKPWKEEQMQEKAVKPKDDQKPPVVYTPPKPRQDTLPKNRPVIVAPLDTVELPVVVLPSPEPIREQPEPVVPIPENDETEGYHTFSVFGTEMKVRWGNAAKFRLDGDNENDFANAYLELTKAEYNNLYNDALKLRTDYQLCDWAYYHMTQALAEAACGKDTEEAVFLQGVMLLQTGYKIRFGYTPNHKLHLLVKTNTFVYEHMTTVIDGERYFIFDKTSDKTINICKNKFPGETDLALDVNSLPLLADDRSEPRTIKSSRYDVVTTTTTNKNLLSFFNTYPTSYSDDNIMTRWAYYANAPLDKETKDSLYAQLNRQMANADQRLKANMLLNWIQTGMKYELDDKVWGDDRAFFPDETLFYPFCDCEDRAILLTRIVRDIMGLDCLLVYYPGHLASAINFTEEVNGDYIMVDGRKFVIADPTYINAPIGRTMVGKDNGQAKVILLRK